MMATTWRTGGVLAVFCALTVVTTFVNKVFHFYFHWFSVCLLISVRSNELNSIFSISCRFLHVLAAEFKPLAVRIKISEVYM